ncbi:MAG: single-stranded-DNA-specific exonuclease RecJ [Proteobacteria bacterium]|nr:single-stranded-DNA-specific exonuclease RecJ [Pseudomonadota bacterium]MBQ4359059.1 single-stranded-DNA-specific exonuclease RecJ [Pseudomonadota bacterium]
MTKPETKYWNLKEPDSDTVDALATDLNETQLLTSVLYNRGVRTPEQAQKFLKPSLDDLSDSMMLSHMQEAVDRCLRAFEKGESVLIFGDNDVDGVTSTTLIYQFFSQLDVNVRYFLPRRKEDGHGFNEETLTAALANGKPDLLVTVDCGMSGFKEVEYLKSLGIDVLIVDHHAPPETLPDTLILNPKLPEDQFPHKDLAAVGVVFHLVQALIEESKRRQIYEKLQKHPPELLDMLDLVCLGTIADVVPLLGENRMFVSVGLDVIRKRKRSGIAALLSDVGADEHYITERTICYRLAPRINAAGRMGDPNECVELLTAYRFTTAQTIAKSLENYNHLRQNAEAAMINEATAMAQQQVLEGRKIIVIARENWQQGILGIISSRILDKFYKPTVVISIADGKGRGSARSPEGFSILDAFSSCKDLLDDFGGHHSAAGLNLKAELIPELTERLEKYASATFSLVNAPRRSLDIDAEASIAQLLKLWQNQYLEQLGPFGTANKEPAFLIRNIRVVLLKRLNHVYARIKIRQTNTSMSVLVPTAIINEIEQNASLDIVVTPKYAPLKEIPEFILLSVRRSDAPDVP